MAVKPAKQKAEPIQIPAIEPGGVFISHVHEDEPLADAFALLIQNVTAGVVPTFRSTAKQFGSGIQYGEEWFRWICESVEKAHHIVALLTPTSTGRPWILFEAGLGKAKPEAVVFGVALGISREDAYKGPFAVFQNCGTDEKELVKLCKELLQGTPAKPRDDMIVKCVQEFRGAVDSFFTNQKQARKQSEDPTSTAVFQALEEMKLMLRDQARIFGAEMPRPLRRDRGAERVLMILDRHDPEFDPELRLMAVAACASQLGHFWVQPFIDYLLKPRQATPDRLERIRYIMHDMFMMMRMESGSKMDSHLLHELMGATDRFISYQLSMTEQAPERPKPPARKPAPAP